MKLTFWGSVDIFLLWIEVPGLDAAIPLERGEIIL